MPATRRCGWPGRAGRSGATRFLRQPHRCRRASAGLPPSCRRIPLRGFRQRPWRPFSARQTSFCGVSGRCWASCGRTWCSPTGSMTPSPAAGPRKTATPSGSNTAREELTGNVKQVWEVSRLQHLTLLATAWFLSHDERYAARVADQLRSWWRENPFLSGVHWTNGIEIGIRLISLTWIRRLLDSWPGVSDLFENDGLAVRQIRWHQQYLAAFPSRGSSANNHVIAEAAGQFVASCAFPWFGESERWRRKSADLLERELVRNTFPSGIGRELASGYQCFIAELGLLAAVEAEAGGHPLSPAVWQRLCAMVDSAAALLDERLRPPRQGDDDEGRALLLDAPVANRWPSLLALGEALFGRLDWWPPVAPDASSSILGALAPAEHDIAGRPAERPSRFADAGITLLRTDAGAGPGDLVPVRRGPARLPQHRRACPRRRPVRRGPLRGRRRPRRSRHLLLSRRAGVAVLLPLHDRAQHGRARRAEPVHRGRSLSLAAARQRPGDRRTRRRRGRQLDRGAHGLQRSRPAGPASPHGPAGPGRRAVSTSSTRSAAATTSGLPFISAPTCTPNWMRPARS